MALQDAYYIGFELDHLHYVLPTKSVYQVFYYPQPAQPSHLLKLDELIVFEGEPYYLRMPQKLLLFAPSDGDASEEKRELQEKASWVVVLKNKHLEKKSSQKGLGFRVQAVTPPFEWQPEVESESVHEVNYAGINYQCLILKEQS
jgi:hypothetical protein